MSQKQLLLNQVNSMELPGKSIVETLVDMGQERFRRFGNEIFQATNSAVLDQASDCPDELAPPEKNLEHADELVHQS